MLHSLATDSYTTEIAEVLHGMGSQQLARL